jgi:Phosphotransferase enzyme family
VETPLEGGNTHASVVRVGDTVRRPTGVWTPGVHALLRHLEHVGFGGAPRVLGIDGQGRESLTYVEGEVVWPGHVELVATGRALQEIGAVVRAFHDAVAGFDAEGYTWSGRGSDPSGPAQVLCHNDLATWNLVRSGGSWVFVDWDLAAPGRRAWDLAWAVLSLVPLMPGRVPDDVGVRSRLGAFAAGYGPELVPGDLLEVAVERAQHEAELIRSLGAAGDPAYARLLADGHAEIWAAAAEHVARSLTRWRPSAA